jgi:hypothetical protein
MKTIKVSDETFNFLVYLAKQNVTLPQLLFDYLKWTDFTKEEIKQCLDELSQACYDPC